MKNSRERYEITIYYRRKHLSIRFMTILVRGPQKASMRQSNMATAAGTWAMADFLVPNDTEICR